jgi:CRP-like cAMP-binding protein
MMSECNFESLIAHASLLKGLTPVELDQLMAKARLRHFPRGEFFFQQGEDAIMLYILTEGRAKLSQVAADGTQVIVNYFGPGDELGIIVALSNMLYPLSAEAIEDCAAFAWHRDQMKALMIQIPQLALNGMEMIGRRFARLQQRFQEVATQRVEQRVARALMRLTRQFGRRTSEGVLLDMPLTREDLAQMTGTNLYNVSRILSKWEQAGYIQTGRGQIVLGKVHELVGIAEDLPTPRKPG